MVVPSRLIRMYVKRRIKGNLKVIDVEFGTKAIVLQTIYEEFKDNPWSTRKLRKALEQRNIIIKELPVQVLHLRQGRLTKIVTKRSPKDFDYKLSNSSLLYIKEYGNFTNPDAPIMRKARMTAKRYSEGK